MDSDAARRCFASQDSAAQQRLPSPERRLRDVRKMKWSSPKSGSFDTTENLLGFLARPWFPVMVATVVAVNTFVLVIPVACIFVALCVKNVSSVLPSAHTVAGGAAVGVAALIWSLEGGALETIGISGSAKGVALTVEEMEQHWPRCLAAIGSYGLLGTVVSFMFCHPLPVVVFALRQKQYSAAIIVLSFLGNFCFFSLVGGLGVAASYLLRNSFRRIFATFGAPEMQSPAPRAAKSAGADSANGDVCESARTRDGRVKVSSALATVAVAACASYLYAYPTL